MKAIKYLQYCWMCFIFLIFQPKWGHAANESTLNPGAIVITLSNYAGLGYLGYAQTLSYIIRDSFPDQKIQIIADVYHKESINIFSFPENTELLVFCSLCKRDNQVEEQAESWLRSASQIILISQLLLEHPSDQFDNRIEINKISGLDTNKLSYHHLSEFISDFRYITSSKWTQKKDIDTLWKTYWKACFDSIKPTQLNKSLIFQGIYSEQQIAKALLRGLQHKLTINEILNNYAPNDSNKFSLKMGFTSGEGILVLPELLNKVKNKSFNTDYQNLRDKYPQLQNILDFASNGFYMSYIHNHFKLAEFITMASLIDGEMDTLVFTNQDSEFLHDKTSSWVFSDNNIRKVEFIDLTIPDNNRTKPEEFFFETDQPQKKVVKVVRLPKITDQYEYLSLFYYSKPVVGTTSNSTLFNAIAMDKLPFYSHHTNFQLNVNDSLAVLDSSSGLTPFFSNKINPQEKALIVKQYMEKIPAWSKQVLKKRLLNQVFIDKIRENLSLPAANSN